MRWMKRMGMGAGWIAVALAVGAAAPSDRFYYQIKGYRDRAAYIRQETVGLAEGFDRLGGFGKGDVPRFREASDKIATLYEKAADAYERDAPAEAERLLKEAEKEGELREVWRTRLWEWRRRQAEAWPTEQWFRDGLRWVPAGARGAFVEMTLARRAASEAWGRVAEATAPGADPNAIEALKEKAYEADARREIAEWRSEWTRRREQIWADKTLKSEELEKQLGQLRRLQEERVRLREADIARDRRVREVERQIRLLDAQAQRTYEVAVEDRQRAERKKQ